MRSITSNIGRNLFNNLIKEKYQAIKSNPYLNFQFGPEKRYEIYCVNNDESKLILGYINEFNVENSADTLPTLFYNKNNAIQAYNLLDSLGSCTYNSFPELRDYSQAEIDQLLYKIDLIKAEDELEFKNDVRLFNELSQSYYFYNINNAYMDLKRINDSLTDKYNFLNRNQVKTLKKLDYILKKYQEIHEGVVQNNEGFFKRTIKRILKR